MLRVVYFSPTHCTQKIISAVAGAMALPAETTDWTLPAGRQSVPVFEEGDTLLLGFPVYEGRVPALLYPALQALEANGNPAVVVALFGNRDYEDALLEMSDILTGRGFAVSAAAAFVGEHSMAATVGAGRPDAEDLALAEDFGRKAALCVEQTLAGRPPALSIDGERPYGERFYRGGIVPETGEGCTRCMLCVQQCPAGAISAEDPAVTDKDACIACCVCVRGCPEKAKAFTHPFFGKMRAFLEENLTWRSEPTLFTG